VGIFSQELIYSIYIFKCMHLKLFIIFPFNGFCHPFDDCSFSRDTFKLFLILVTCVFSPFFPQEVCQFYWSFQRISLCFIDFIYEFNVFYFIDFHSSLFSSFCFQSFSNFFKNWRRALLNLFFKVNITLTTMRTL